MHRFIYILLVFILSFGSTTMAQSMQRAYSKYHLLMENGGQWPKEVKFRSQMSGGYLWVQEGKFVYHLVDRSEVLAKHHGGDAEEEGEVKQTVVHANLLGANRTPRISKSEPSADYHNFFLGNDSSKWTSKVRSYSKVRMYDLYPGIHLDLHQEPLKLKYEFVLEPKADPSDIRIEFAGQEKLKIDRDGNLRIYTELGEVIEEKPYVYQIINGRIKEVTCSYHLEENTLSFDLGKYNDAYELIIDPELVFATYCGAVSDNFGMTATYGYDGTAYSGGIVFGNAYPMPDGSAYDINGNFTVPNGPAGITDVFISKYSADGTNMIWSTYLGGGNNNSGVESVHSLICDLDNNVYLYGVTSSTDFPTVNPVFASHQGGTNLNISQNGLNFGAVGTDIYVAKLSANGQNLMGSTYYGGARNDGVNYRSTAPTAQDSLTRNYGDQFRGEIMLGVNQEVIVASSTYSTNFPTQNPIQAANAGRQDGVLFALSNDLSSIVFSTYIGGTSNDACYSVKVDSAYSIVFAGGTVSSDLPVTPGTYQQAYQGGSGDGFVGKLNMTGSNLDALTYVGTGNYDQTYFVEIDRNNKVFLYGQSFNGQFPVVNAGYVNANANHFVAKFDSALTVIERSTTIGQSNSTQMLSPTAFLVDKCGEIFISGWGPGSLVGSLQGFPTTDDAFQQTPTNSADFYLFVMDRSFSDIIYGSYLGGGEASEHVDGGTSRFDRSGIVYQSVCAGCGGRSDFPTSEGAWSSSNNSSNCNNLVFKFDFQIQTEANFTLEDTLACTEVSVQLQNNSTSYTSFFWLLDDGDTSFVFEPVISYDSAGVYEIKLVVTDSTCLTVDTATFIVTIGENHDLVLPSNILFCESIDTLLLADTQGAADTVVWSSNRFFTDTLNNPGQDSSLFVSTSNNVTYYVHSQDGPCYREDSVSFVRLENALDLINELSLCVPDDANIQAQVSPPGTALSYNWSPSNIILGPTDQQSVTINTDSSQYLYLDAFFSAECNFYDSVFIDVHSFEDLTAVATASPDTIPENGNTTLNVQPDGYNYSWEPDLFFDDPNLQTQNISVSEDATFIVHITDGVCSTQTSVQVITFPFECERGVVYVPNAFSPNGDGQNDVLFVRSKVVESVLFRVYSRWGQLLFETTDMNNGWDGTYKGKLVDPDTYDYYLEVTCFGEETRFFKGNVTLLR